MLPRCASTLRHNATIPTIIDAGKNIIGNSPAPGALVVLGLARLRGCPGPCERYFGRVAFRRAPGYRRLGGMVADSNCSTHALACLVGGCHHPGPVVHGIDHPLPQLAGEPTLRTSSASEPAPSVGMQNILHSLQSQQLGAIKMSAK
jgi:hypothetical protein